MFLLDTNVVSELRRSERADPRVLAWVGTIPLPDMYLSVMTLLELEIGTLSRMRRDIAQGMMLRQWIETRVTPNFAGRVLQIDLPVALRCAALHVPDKRPERDAMIAATALVHGLTVVTRNIADFQPMGVAVLNPWDS